MGAEPGHDARMDVVRPLRFHVASLVGTLLLPGALAGVAACPAAAPVPPVVVDEEPPPPIPLPTEECDLTAAAIPFLPRTSNDEVRQLTSDLLGAPVDAALFVRWTPLAHARHGGASCSR